MVLTETRQYMEVPGNAPADVTFRCDGETCILLMSGRLLAHEAVAQGRITCEGDTELAVACSQRFKGREPLPWDGTPGRAADCLQRLFLRCFRFRQQLTTRIPLV